MTVTLQTPLAGCRQAARSIEQKRSRPRNCRKTRRCCCLEKVPDDVFHGLVGHQMRSAPQAGRRPSSLRLRPGTADRIVRRVEQQYQLGMSAEGEPFAVPRDGNGVAILLRESGEEMMERLAADIHRQESGPPKASALRDALLAIRGLAADGPREALHLRHAKHGEKLVIDIGDATGRVIVVTPGVGYAVQRRSPVLFRRTAFTAPLPIPSRGKRLNDLRKLVNVSEEDFELLVGWLIAALIPDITHPVALLTGPPGTGKSWGAETLLALLDPSIAPFGYRPRTVRAWHRLASQRRSVILDDVRSIRPEVRDAIYGSITGNAQAWRQPGDPVFMPPRNVVMATAVDPWVLRGDLVEHQLRLELMPIVEEKRLDDQALMERRAKLLPGILGALLCAAANTLRPLRGEKLEHGQSMLEFKRVLGAADAAHATIDARIGFVAQQEDIRYGILDRDPFGSAVRDFAWNQRRWEGTPEELLTALGPAPALRLPTTWPSHNHVSARLKRRELHLVGHGVLIEWLRPTNPFVPERLQIRVIEGPDESESSSAGLQSLSTSQDDDEQHHL